MSEAVLSSPHRPGLFGPAVVGAFAGLCTIATALVAFLLYAGSTTHGIADAVWLGVDWGIRGVMIIMSLGWFLAFPCAFLLTASMIAGERASPGFATPGVWLLASLVASSPLVWLLSLIDESQRLDEPGVLHVIYAAGLIGAGAAWYWRHGGRGAER